LKLPLALNETASRSSAGLEYHINLNLKNPRIVSNGIPEYNNAATIDYIGESAIDMLKESARQLASSHLSTTRYIMPLYQLNN
jgi:hypothetical protein